MVTLKNSGFCAAIAFMGMKLKTEVVTVKPVVDLVSTKNLEEELDPPQQNDGEFVFPLLIRTEFIIYFETWLLV